MPLDVSACCPAFLDHEQPGYCGGSPAEPLEADAAGQPHLRVVSTEHLLDRGQLRLELDDEQRPRARCHEKIDRAALAEDRERNLRRDLPARRLQEPGRRFSEACMPGVEKAVEVAAAPAHEQDEIRVQGLDDSRERRQREPLDAAPLDERDHRLRHAGLRRQLPPGPAEPMPQRPGGSTDPNVAHARRMAPGAYPPLTRGLPATYRWVARLSSRSCRSTRRNHPSST
jgi:hypothetical protein